MPEWLIALFDNFTVLRIHSLFGFVLLGLFVVYFFSREGRDERGRKVIPIAALCAFAVLFVAMNWLGYVYGGGWALDNEVRAMQCAQLAYTVVLLTADVSILIVRNLNLK